MGAISFTQFRKHLSDVLEQARFEPVVITRADGRDVVIIDKAEYEAMQETLHLMSSPENARRLTESIEELERGAGAEHPLVP